MKDFPRTILTETVRGKVRSRLIVFCSLAMLLCFTAVVTPRLASSGAVPVKSSPVEDQLWREIQQVGTVAGIEAGQRFYRALSLDENAQRKLLRHAPMEFSKA